MSLLVIVLLLFVGMVIFFLLLGGLTAGSGADLLDWDPGGRAERRAGLDHADLEEMLELNNSYRREHGQPELSEEDLQSGGNLQSLRGADPPVDPYS
ncbi:MAG: hypothetical protein ACYDHH_17110 [Solirubrobacteraceae bacterium]